MAKYTTYMTPKDILDKANPFENIIPETDFMPLTIWDFINFLSF